MDPMPSSDLQRRLVAWRDAVADLAFTSAFATPDGGGDHLRMLTELIATHPHGALDPNLAEVVRLLDAGAEASAALTLVESLAGYMLSCAPGGRHLASVVLAGQAQEFHAEGASAALALVGALAAALAGPPATLQRSDGETRPGPELRLN